jgi:hypothetical protein
LNADEYTPIIAPVDCAFYSLVCSSDYTVMMRSSDPTNQSAWHETKGYAFTMAPTFRRNRWRAGETVTWLKASAGTPDAIVEFIPGDWQ